MSSVAPPLPTVPLADDELLERLRAVRKLEASLVAELRARSVEPRPSCAGCGLGDRQLVVYSGPNNTLAVCSACARRQRDTQLARETRTEFAARFHLLPDGG